MSMPLRCPSVVGWLDLIIIGVLVSGGRSLFMMPTDNMYSRGRRLLDLAREKNIAAKRCLSFNDGK